MPGARKTSSGSSSDSRAKEFGRDCERLAAEHLKKLGYKVIATNYRTVTGELDIVAEDGGTLVFVEVKARRGNAFGAPVLAVNAHKQRQLTRTALSFIANRRRHGSPCRFDIVSVSGSPGDGGGLEISVIKDAFELSEGY
jgi:putative endonuclease